MKNFQKGFTLVELIVVITILAILGTIGFISLGGYSRYARNAKKTSDLNAISTQIASQVTRWMSLLTFAANSGSTITGTNIKISWLDDYTLFSDKYIAGDINATVLGLTPWISMDDVYKVPYKFGATTLWDGTYELAATIEEAGSDSDTLVVGTWNPRQSSNVRGTRDYIQNDTFFLTWAMYWDLWFKIGDTVWISTGTYMITNLKGGNEIHLNTAITTPGANIFLKVDESRHLIKKRDSNFPIDTWKWIKYVPYK